VSAGQFSQFLSSVKLNDEPVRWADEDLSYLAAAVWDADMAAAVAGARAVASLADFFSAACAPGAARDVKLAYAGQAEYAPIAQRFGYLDDEKAGVPRTAYKGVVVFPHEGCRKFVVPRV